MFFIDKIKSAIFPTLTPSERWEKESQACARDLKIKKVALECLKIASIGTGLVSLATPFIATALSSTGLGLAIGAIVMCVFGVAGSVFSFYKAHEAENYFDWTDYSNKITVMQETRIIKECSLRTLADNPQSIYYRINNLCKYGVLSSESANSIKDIFSRYIIARNDYEAFTTLHGYKFKGSCSEDAEIYDRLKAKLNTIKHEWSQFQSNVAQDLPNIFI